MNVHVLPRFLRSLPSTHVSRRPRSAGRVPSLVALLALILVHGPAPGATRAPSAGTAGIRLTGAIPFSAGADGAMDAYLYWDNIGGNGVFNLWIARGRPEGSPDLAVRPLLNGPGQLEAFIDIPLQPGRNEFTLLGALPWSMTEVMPQQFGLNLFLDGGTLAGISALETSPSGTWPPAITANSSPNTLDAAAEGGPAAGTLVYKKGDATVTLTEFYWANPPAVPKVDRVGPWEVEPEGTEDAVGLLVLQVSGMDNPLPVITRQPQSQTVRAGSPATFTVAVTGLEPFSYRWRRDGVDLIDGANVSGATTDTLRLSAVNPSEGGAYSVLILNAAGPALSVDARLEVTVVPSPVIAMHPRSATVTRGQPSALVVLVNGTGPFTYAWTRNGSPVHDGGTVSGALTATLRIAEVQPSDEGEYQVRVTNEGGTVLSEVARLTVDVPVPPRFVVQPAHRTVDTGATVSFAVEVTGDPPFEYVWMKSGLELVAGGNLTGVRGPILTLAAAAESDAGEYVVRVSNRGGFATSDPAVLAVVPPSLPTFLAPGVAPAVAIIHPQIAGHPAVLETSDDLARWTTAGPATVATDGTLRVYASTRPPRAHAFFRLRVPENGTPNCRTFDWSAALGLLPDGVLPAMSLDDRSDPENPVLQDGAVILGNDDRTEGMWYAQIGASLLIPTNLVLEAELRFGTGSSLKIGRSAAAIGFTSAPGMGGLVGFGPDEVYFSYGPDERGETVAVDTDGTYHRYRIEVDDSQTPGAPIRLYQDDVLILTDALRSGGPNHGQEPVIWFGEGTEWASGTSFWRTFKHNATLCTTDPAATGPAVGIARVLELFWRGDQGTFHQLQWSTPATPDDWRDLGETQPGTGAELSAFDPEPAAGFRSYRVRVTR